MDTKSIIQFAVKAKDKSYSPYSKFRVGAALITDKDKVYIGSNVENSSYGLSICAERTALFAAVLEGEKNFKSIAVVSDADDFCPPCGACRQVMLEFCGKDMDVIMTNKKNETKILKLKELLPFSFTNKMLT